MDICIRWKRVNSDMSAYSNNNELCNMTKKQNLDPLLLVRHQKNVIRLVASDAF